MTEMEVRQKYVDAARRFYGASTGGEWHKLLVDTYNNHRPLARGYALQYDDDWCVGFVSAIAILCDLTDIIPTEVGTDKMIALFQQMGEWEERDSYVPKPGDIIFYDWDDDGVGDNQEMTSHVGIVDMVYSDSTFRTIEGNWGGRVAHATREVNGRYIRGYGVPKYEKYAKEDEEMVRWNKLEEVPEWAKATIQKLMDRDILLGDENGNLMLSEDMTRILVINDRAGLYEVAK